MSEQQDVRPARTALVAIDFQYDIVGAGGAFAGLFHAEVERITSSRRLLGQVAQYGCLIDGTPGAAIIDAVAPHRQDVVLTHHRVSCFHGTELDVVLRGAGIDTVVVAGVATDAGRSSDNGRAARRFRSPHAESTLTASIT